METTAHHQAKLREIVTIDAPTARELIMNQGTHRYLDVRMPEDFNRRGHVEGAINVPYYSPDSPEVKVKNQEFLDQVSAVCGKDDHLIVGCMTGGRSKHATADLLEAGFKNVKNIGGGYAAWKEAGKSTA